LKENTKKIKIKEKFTKFKLVKEIKYLRTLNNLEESLFEKIDEKKGTIVPILKISKKATTIIKIINCISLNPYSLFNK
jgi:hypothetical protein